MVNNKNTAILSPIVNEIIITTTEVTKVTTKIQKLILEQIFLSQREQPSNLKNNREQSRNIPVPYTNGHLPSPFYSKLSASAKIQYKSDTTIKPAQDKNNGNNKTTE